MKTPLEIANDLAVLFYPLPQPDLRALASIIEPGCYAVKGEVILRKGQISRHIYHVESGLLRQFYYKKGREITEHFSCEGNHAVCIVSTFMNQPTELMVEALVPTIYHRISYNGLEELVNTSMPISRLYHKILENDLIISQWKADSWRFETAKERYIRFQRDFPEAAKRASVNHIASYLLMSPETLSRLRSEVF